MVEDVYHIPSIHANLLLMSQSDRRGQYVTFGDNKVFIQKSPTGNIVAAWQQIGRSYELVDGTDYSDVYASDSI